MKNLANILSLVLSFVSICMESKAQEAFKSVKDMGDIWVVTIDKSGSMLYNASPSSLGYNVYNRLINCPEFSSIDFNTDRFIFLTSGYSYSESVGLGNELKKSEPFDKTFIHFTDNKLHSFAGKKECAMHIKNIMSRNDYDHRMSFVSQIRTFSIIHAVNLIKDLNESDSFDNLFVLTITDDADRNDQWMLDYRLLKKCASAKVKEVNDSTSKYFYNSFNGHGLGNLDELYGDENQLPHLWIYRYRTLESSVPCAERDIVKIDATDGKILHLVQKHRIIDGDKICFIHIDSVRVNNRTLQVNTSFEKSFTGRFDYDNSLKTNDVSLHGYVQLKYYDPIYGPHYKLVPFIQHSRVLSNVLSGFICWIIIICIIGFLLFLLYVLVIRTRLVLFTIYSGTGIKTTVFRGFSFEWKVENIHIQCYEDKGGNILECIIKHHKRIRVESIELEDSTHADEILIASNRPINISVNTKSITTDEDIERVYYVRSGLYPFLLKTEYEKTRFFELYRNYSAANNKIYRKFLKNMIALKNIFDKTYYYPISSVKTSQNIYIAADSVLKDKRFILEYANIKEPQSSDIYCDVACSALCSYYDYSNNLSQPVSGKDNPENEIIVASYSIPDSIIWTIIKIDGRESLKTARLLVKYREKSPEGDAKDGFEIIYNYLSKTYGTSKIGHISVSDLVTKYNFDIETATAPCFISFIESCERPKSQTLYSPLTDFEIKEKFVRINQRCLSGYFAISLIPVKYIKERLSFMTLPSKEVVRDGIKSSSMLKLKETNFEFRDINYKY